jgi:hypothetical protein
MFILGLASSIFADNVASPFLLLAFALVLVGCAIGTQTPPKIAIIWAGVLLFTLQTVIGMAGALLAGILFLMPCVAMKATRDTVKGLIVVVTAFALGLIYQHFFAKDLQFYNRAMWPMSDPNSAGALVNLALVPCLLMRKKVLSVILLCGLFVTGSKGAMIGLCAALGVYFFVTGGKHIKAAVLCAVAALGVAVFKVPMLYTALAQRFPTWDTAKDLVTFHGMGHGSYVKMYPHVRTEDYTAGQFANNDLLQFAIEMGWPIAVLFTMLCGYVMLKTTRENLIPACAMLAILTQSLVSFPLYIPAVSIGMGIVLKWWHDEQRA